MNIRMNRFGSGFHRNPPPNKVEISANNTSNTTTNSNPVASEVANVVGVINGLENLFK
jgi:hypothetical protein